MWYGLLAWRNVPRRSPGGRSRSPGSELTGDFDALAQGRRTTIREAPRITLTDAAVPPARDGPHREPARPAVPAGGAGRTGKPVHLIIDAVPRRLTAPGLCDEINGQIRPEGWQPPEQPPGLRLKLPAKLREQMAARALPIAGMRDESGEDDA